MKKLILFFSILLLNSILVFSYMDCSLRDGFCDAGETKILAVDSDINSHVELPSYDNLDKFVCCKDNESVYDINNSCGTVFLKLSDQYNAHAAEKDYSGYPVSACMDSSGAMDVACYYSDSDCHAGKSCVLSFDEGSSNFHIGDCDTYSRKLCCGFVDLPDYDDFFKPNNPTTDFEAVSDITAVEDMVLADDSGSFIQWKGMVDAEGEDYDGYVVVEENYVSLNTSLLDLSIDSEASVSVTVGGCDNWNIYYLDRPAVDHQDILDNGIIVGTKANGCNVTLSGDAAPYCSNVQCVGYTLSYDVLHFDSTGAEGEGSPGGEGAIPEFSTLGIIFALVMITMGMVVIRKKR